MARAIPPRLSRGDSVRHPRPRVSRRTGDTHHRARSGTAHLMAGQLRELRREEGCRARRGSAGAGAPRQKAAERRSLAAPGSQSAAHPQRGTRPRIDGASCRALGVSISGRTGQAGHRRRAELGTSRVRGGARVEVVRQRSGGRRLFTADPPRRPDRTRRAERIRQDHAPPPAGRRNRSGSRQSPARRRACRSRTSTSSGNSSTRTRPWPTA